MQNNLHIVHEEPHHRILFTMKVSALIHITRNQSFISKHFGYCTEISPPQKILLNLHIHMCDDEKIAK